MKKSLIAHAIISMVFFASFCFAQEETSFFGKVNANDVNVRAGANINFEIITKLNNGELVEVLGKSFNWYKIKLPKKISCFVSKEFVLPEDQNQGKIKTNRVNLRTRPNINSTILGQLNKNDEVIILGKKNNWYEIEMPQTCFGWVNIKYISYFSKRGTVKISEDKNLNEKIPNKLILKSQETLPVAIGIVKPCGIFLKRPGTHKLMEDGKIIYFLKGDKSLLESFINYKVKVWGRIVNLPNQKTPLIIVEKISIQE